MNQDRTGFTVIEVVLVLAIAGIIFAGVFITLPSLWAAQRDADRKSNAIKFVNAVKTYQTNNSRGALPTTNNYENFTLRSARSSNPSAGTWQALVKDYLDPDFGDPRGVDYGYDIFIMKCIDSNGKELSTGQPCKSYGGELNFYGMVNGVDFSSFDGNSYPALYVSVGATCNGNVAVKSNSPRNFSVITVLENGDKYCHNS